MNTRILGASLSLTLFLLMCQTPVQQLDFSSLSEEQQHLPENALAGMELAEGLEATVFAAEPTLINPTNMHIDEKGRVWVIEALNYRNRFNPDNPYRKEGDRILILEDTDGDGKSDQTKVFYQGEDINSALGIWVMGNQVIVSSSPNIFLFTDTNGDDLPDDKKVLFTNIEGWDHDHGAHAFIFGPDGRLYFNLGNEGVQLQNTDSTTLIDINGKAIQTGAGAFRQGLALRCEVDGTGLEVVGHNFRNNFELAVDSYGTIWQSDNDDDGNKATRINYVMEYGNYGYTDEITGAGWRKRRIGMHQEIPKRHWHLNDPGVVPNLLQTGAGSPTGILFYEGDLLPEPFQQQMIHCEPGHQVVRAYPVRKDGAGYKAEIVTIMKGKDKWFRPSDVCVAPDGSIFVADWYDPGVGGHKMGDVDRGRIYRIAPKGTTYKIPKFDLNSPKQAVKALQSPNLSVRYLAWNVLKDWGVEAEAALNELWQGTNQPMRARALWLLARIEGKTQVYLDAAIKDDNPDIRVTGLRAARQLDKQQLIEYLNVCQNDPAAEVRREVAIALRHFPDEQLGAPIWTNLAKQYNGKDRWYLEALGLAADLHASAYFKNWMETIGSDWNTAAGRDLIWRSRAEEALPYLIRLIKDPDTGEKDMMRYFRAFHFHNSGEKETLLASLLTLDHPLKQQIGAYTIGLLNADFVNANLGVKQQISQLLPQIAGSPEWLSAVTNLKLGNQNEALLRMFLEQEDRSLAVEAGQALLDLGGNSFLKKALLQAEGADQKAFINRMGWIRSGDAAPDLLLEILLQRDYATPIKRLLVDALGNSWTGQHHLFDLLEANQLEETLVNTAALKIMYSWDTKLRKAAPSYLKVGGDGAPIAPMKELLEANGDIAKGALVFEEYCANCHQVQGEGVNFGPDLSEIGDKLAERALYSAILYPSAGINFGYEGYIIRMKDGAVYNGFIESETEDEIKLRMMGGISQTIDKLDIVSKEEMDRSLMIEGLHTLMGEAALIDLVAYLSTLKKSEEIIGD